MTEAVQDALCARFSMERRKVRYVRDFCDATKKDGDWLSAPYLYFTNPCITGATVRRISLGKQDYWLSFGYKTEDCSRADTRGRLSQKVQESALALHRLALSC
jgi:hypothetical protein